MILELFFDGGARKHGSACGYIIKPLKNTGEIFWGGKFMGNKTNNESEYLGLIMGLKRALNEKITALHIFGDSALVVNQVNGNWKIKKPHLQKYCDEAQALLEEFDYYKLSHVPRDKNSEADWIVDYFYKTRSTEEADNNKTNSTI